MIARVLSSMGFLTSFKHPQGKNCLEKNNTFLLKRFINTFLELKSLTPTYSEQQKKTVVCNIVQRWIVQPMHKHKTSKHWTNSTISALYIHW